MKRIIVFIHLITLLSFGLLHATDYYVNASSGSNTTGNGSSGSPWKTITYALSQIGGTGHTLYVSAGTYNTALGETFPILMKDGVSLIGAGIDVSVVDAGGTNTVVRCVGIVDPSTRLEAFTLTGGGNVAEGGGVFISAGSALIVADNEISENSSYDVGGGIYVSNSSPAILNNVIIWNSCGDQGSYAGGIYVANSAALIQGNMIAENIGTGVYIVDSSPLVQDNVISGNLLTTLYDFKDGRGIYVTGSTSSPRIIHNVIDHNAYNGIECRWGTSRPKIINNTISDNTDDGIYLYYAAPDSISNNIISLNSGYGIQEDGATNDPGKSWYNLYFANTLALYRDEGTTNYYTASSLNSSVAECANNLSGDPMFVDKINNNYNILFGSPAIDAGDPNSPLDPDGTRSDAGAFYYPQALSIHVTSPNTFNTYYGRTTETITWESNGFGMVDILYSVSGGLDYRTVVLNKANDGSYAWLVPNISTANGRILVQSASNYTIRDSSDTEFTIVPVPPAAPQNLSIVTSDRQVTLKWNKNTEPDFRRYRIFQSTLPNPSVQTDSMTSGINDTVKVISGLEYGITYYFRVTAVDTNFLQSTYSNEVDATPLNEPPAAPQNLSIVTSDRQVTLKWNKNSEPDFRRYRIFQSTLPNPSVQTDSMTSGITDTVKVISGLEYGITYYFRITAVDTNFLQSTYSNEVDATPLNEPPAVPQNLTATSGDGQVLLRWEKNTELDFLRYRIFQANAPNASDQIDSSVGGFSDTTKLITGLLNGATYYFRITAVDSEYNQSIYSNEVTSTPEIPVDLLQDFELPTFPPAGWSIDSTVSPVSYWARLDYASGYGIGAAAAVYDFYDDNLGFAQSMITHTFTPTALGDSLQFDHAYATYDSQIDSLIIQISSDNGLSFVDLIRLQGGSTVGIGMVTADPITDPFIPTSSQWRTKSYPLPLGTNKIKFKTKSAYGNNLWLDNIAIKGAGSVNFLPSVPQNLSAAAGDGYVALRWTKNLDLDFMRYRIYQSGSPNASEQVDSTIGGRNDTTKTISGLMNGTQYYYRVTAVDSSYLQSAYSNEVNAVPQTTVSSDSIYIKIKLASIPDSLIFSSVYVPDNTQDYAWSMYVDADNNTSTGPNGGYETQIVLNHFRSPGESPFKATLIGGTQHNVLEWIGTSGYIRHSDFPVRIDPADANTLSLALPKSWSIVSAIDTLDRHYFYTYYMTSSTSSETDQTAVSTNSKNTDAVGDASYGFVDLISVELNTGATISSPPSPPSNLTAVAGNGKVTLRWESNTEPDFLRYRIYRSTSPNASIQVDSASGGVSDTAKTITGLVNGITYYFRVAAVNGTMLQSAYSNEVNAIPNISNLITFRIDLKNLILKNRFDPLNDIVDVRGSFNSWSSLTQILADADSDSIYTKTIDVGTTSPTEYKFALRRRGEDIWENVFATSSGNREYVPTGDPQTLPAVWFNDGALPNPWSPHNLVAIPGDGQIVLHWNNNTEADFLRYRIYFSIIPEATIQIDSATGGINDTTRIISVLPEGYIYYFRVTAVDSMYQYSNFSNEVSSIFASGRAADSLALVTLFDSTGGTNWTNKTNWKSSNPIDTWYGVTVSDNRVVTIGLQENNMTGSLPAEMGSMTQLQEVNFFINNLSGPIPVTCGNLTKLRNLNLANNSLSGQFPFWIGNLVELQDLALFFNQLSGNIPASIGNLSQLQNLQIGHNLLTGSIPVEVGNLSNLHDAALDVNHLSGDVPNLNGLTNLHFLALGFNHLTGLPDLSSLTALDDLWVNDNNLTFEDIEPNIGGPNNEFLYYNQDSVGIYSTLTMLQETADTLSVDVGGENNQYQWMKNGVDIDGATSCEYYKPYWDVTDSGNYVCRITNTVATELTLYSRHTRVIVYPMPTMPGNLVAVPVTSSRIDLSWTASSDATKYYISRSLTSGSGFNIIDSVNVPATSYSNTGLSVNTTYYYRIYAVNQYGGTSSNSNEVSATTLGLAPSLGTPNVSNPSPIPGAAVTITVTATGTSPAVKLFYGKTTQSEGDSLAMTFNGTNYSGTIPGASVTQEGVWFRIRAQNTGGIVYYPGTTTKANISVTINDMTSIWDNSYFYGGIPAEQYFSIAMSMDGSLSLTDLWGTQTLEEGIPTNWRAWDFNRTSQSFVDVTTLSGDKAYFLFHREGSAQEIFNSVTSKKTNDPLMFDNFLLSPGWNAVPWPFTFPANIYIKDTNQDSIGSLWKLWGNSGWEQVTECSAFCGYMIYNKTAGDVRLGNVVSWTMIATKPMIDQSGWRMRLIVESGSYRDAYNFAGVSKNYSTMNEPEPLTIGNSVTLNFKHNEQNLSSDIRSDAEDGHIWDLSVVNTSGNDRAILKWESVGLPADLHVMLIDVSNNKIFRLDETIHEYEFKTHRQNIFKLIAGNAEFVEREALRIKATLPDEFGLSQNYPNPFNPSTTIKFDVARSGQVKLKVYNILGQEIATLVNGYFETGQDYSVIWDGRDSFGKSVASGMYIYRLEAGRITKTRKMLLVK